MRRYRIAITGRHMSNHIKSNQVMSSQGNSSGAKSSGGKEERAVEGKGVHKIDIGFLKQCGALNDTTYMISLDSRVE